MRCNRVSPIIVIPGLLNGIRFNLVPLEYGAIICGLDGLPISVLEPGASIDPNELYLSFHYGDSDEAETD